MIVSTKTDPAVQDVAGLPVVALAAAKVYSAMLEVPPGVANAIFKSVKVYYVKDTATDVHLKFTLRHIETATLPSTPTTNADADYVDYVLSGSTGQIESLSVPALTIAAFTGMDSGDQVGIDIDRKVGDTGTFNILRVDFELDGQAVATAIDIVTLDDIKGWFGKTDTVKDSLLQLWITTVSEWFEEECQRKFQLQTITGEILDGDGTGEIYPRWAPINSLPSVDTTQDVMFRDDPTQAWQVLEATASKILINPNEAWKICLYDNFFPLGKQNIKLNYRAGYAAIPRRLQMAAWEAVQIMWKQSKQGDNLLMLQSESRSEAGFNFNTVYKDMSKESHDALNLYRRLV
jgi:hypothetical protein